MQGCMTRSPLVLSVVVGSLALTLSLSLFLTQEIHTFAAAVAALLSPHSAATGCFLVRERL